MLIPKQTYFNSHIYVIISYLLKMSETENDTKQAAFIVQVCVCGGGMWDVCVEDVGVHPSPICRTLFLLFIKSDHIQRQPSQYHCKSTAIPSRSMMPVSHAIYINNNKFIAAQQIATIHQYAAQCGIDPNKFAHPEQLLKISKLIL